MEWLIWIGAAISAAGIAGILWCILLVTRARREGLADAELRARMQRIVALNLGAFFLSVIGLMMVAAGVLLA